MLALSDAKLSADNLINLAASAIYFSVIALANSIVGIQIIEIVEVPKDTRQPCLGLMRLMSSIFLY